MSFEFHLMTWNEYDSVYLSPVLKNKK